MKTIDEIYQEMLSRFGERTGLEPRESRRKCPWGLPPWRQWSRRTHSPPPPAPGPGWGHPPTGGRVAPGPRGVGSVDVVPATLAGLPSQELLEELEDWRSWPPRHSGR